MPRFFKVPVPRELRWAYKSYRVWKSVNPPSTPRATYSDFRPPRSNRSQNKPSTQELSHAYRNELMDEYCDQLVMLISGFSDAEAKLSDSYEEDKKSLIGIASGGYSKYTRQLRIMIHCHAFQSIAEDLDEDARNLRAQVRVEQKHILNKILLLRYPSDIRKAREEIKTGVELILELIEWELGELENRKGHESNSNDASRDEFHMEMREFTDQVNDHFYNACFMIDEVVLEAELKGNLFAEGMGSKICTQKGCGYHTPFDEMGQLLRNSNNAGCGCVVWPFIWIALTVLGSIFAYNIFAFDIDGTNLLLLFLLFGLCIVSAFISFMITFLLHNLTQGRVCSDCGRRSLVGINTKKGRAAFRDEYYKSVR